VASPYARRGCDAMAESGRSRQSSDREMCVLLSKNNRRMATERRARDRDSQKHIRSYIIYSMCCSPLYVA